MDVDKWFRDTCDYTLEVDESSCEPSIPSFCGSYFCKREKSSHLPAISSPPSLKQSPAIAKTRDLSPPKLTACRLRDIPSFKGYLSNHTCCDQPPPVLQPFTLHENFDWDLSSDLIPLPDPDSTSDDQCSVCFSQGNNAKYKSLDYSCLHEFLDYVAQSVAFLLSFHSHQETFSNRQCVVEVYKHILLILEDRLTCESYPTDQLQTSVWFGILEFLKDIKNDSENVNSLLLRGLKCALYGLRASLNSRETKP